MLESIFLPHESQHRELCLKMLAKASEKFLSRAKQNIDTNKAANTKINAENKKGPAERWHQRRAALTLPGPPGLEGRILICAPAFGVINFTHTLPFFCLLSGSAAEGGIGNGVCGSAPVRLHQSDQEHGTLDNASL